MAGDNSVDHARIIRLFEELNIAKPPNAFDSILGAAVTVDLDPCWADTENGQTIADVLIRILLRTGFDVQLACPERWVPKRLVGEAQEDALALGRSFRTSDSVDHPTPRVAIGDAFTDTADVFAKSSGWTAYVGEKPLSLRSVVQNPVGASLCGAWAAAEVFKLVMGRELSAAGVSYRVHHQLVFSAWDYDNPHLEGPVLPTSVDVGDTIVVGIGAVGLACLHLLSRLPCLHGTLTLVDQDVIDRTNVARYLTANRKSIGQAKVRHGAKLFAGRSDLSVISFEMTYESFARDIGRDFNLALCAVDNIDTRFELQSDLPRVMVDAGTRDVCFGIRRFCLSQTACAACMFRPREDTYALCEAVALAFGWNVDLAAYNLSNKVPLTSRDLVYFSQRKGVPLDTIRCHENTPITQFIDKEICGHLVLSSGEGPQSQSGAIGFVSAVPGFLLAAELVKQVAFPEQALKGCFEASVLYGPSKHSHCDVSRVADCPLCGDAVVVAAYRRKHGAVN